MARFGTRPARQTQIVLVCVVVSVALVWQAVHVRAEVDIVTRRQLNDGNTIPLYGLGTYKAAEGKAYEAVLAAIAIGYRHIDTAARYGNEEDVGRAVRDSGIPREELFITTKLWNDDHGFDNAIEACERSLQRLGMDYVDLYLIHAPVPGERLETWRALEQLKAMGKARSIGVSNYGTHHLQELMAVAEVKPAVNQIEIHPFFIRDELVIFCEDHDIAIEGYSPLAKARRLEDPDLMTLGGKYGRSPAQIMLRWAIQHNFITIPKSISPRRIRENADVFSFTISHEDMALLNAKHEDLATGWNPVDDPAFF